MKTTRRWLAVVVLASGLIACDKSDDKSRADWNAWNQLVKPTLTVQAPEWQGIVIQRVCLEIEQSYVESMGEYSLPISEPVGLALRRAGIGQIREGACDNTLRVVLRGTPRHGSYIPGGICYNGGEIEGEIQLSASNRGVLNQPFKWLSRPPRVMPQGNCKKRARDAPIDEIWQKPVLVALAKIWGLEFLVRQLGAPDPEPVYYGAPGAY